MIPYTFVKHKEKNLESRVLTPPAVDSEWGTHGLPLLPRALREAWATTVIPPFALHGSDLLEGTTVGMLDAHVWDTMPTLPPALERYLLQLVKDRFHSISALPIFEQSDPGDIGWSAIVEHALSKAGLSSPERLRALTYGDVLALRGIGVRRMLELAVVAERDLERKASSGADAASTESHSTDAVEDDDTATTRNTEPTLEDRYLMATAGLQDHATSRDTVPALEESVLQWGQLGAPLLPSSLRAALADVRPPAEVIERLHLPPETTLAAFDRTIWSHISDRPEDRAIIERYLVSALTAWRETVTEVPALGRPWPRGLELHDVPWRPRTRNALMRGGLTDVDRLTQATYGELLGLRNMGSVSVLDFAATAEAAIDHHESMEQEAAAHEEIAVEALRDVVGDEWVETVVEDDPRFASLVHGVPQSTRGRGPTYHKEYAEGERTRDMVRVEAQPAQLALFEHESMRATIEQAREIREMPLDRALRDYMQALSGATGPRLDALLMRFGWDGLPPRTLDECARVVNVSRERMRQIQARIMEKKPHNPVFLPALDWALEALAQAAPVRAMRAADLLRERRITTVPFHPASVLSAAEFCGHTPTFSLDGGPLDQTVVTTSALAYANRVSTLAARLAGGSGASNVAEVEAVAAAAGLDVNIEQVREVLRYYSKVRFLNDDWFWTPEAPIDRNRLYNVTRRILSVARPVSVGTLRDGVRRHFRGRQHGRPLPLIVPPRAVLLAFYEAHPAFVVTDDGQVDSSEDLDYRTQLGSTERALVEILRSSPSGILSRQELADACAARGINLATFDAYLTYSAIIEHLGTGIWGLRGAAVDPVAVEALLSELSLRTRARRVVGYGWTPDGELWLTWRVAGNNIHSAVIGIPAAIARFVGGQSFEAKASDDGSAVGTITVGEMSNTGAYNSWGYSSFLTRRGADDGDVLRIEFDLTTNQAKLSLEDEESLSNDELPGLVDVAVDDETAPVMTE